MDRQSLADSLMLSVYNNNIKDVESTLELGDSGSWREIIRFEFILEKLLTTLFKDNLLMQKLVAYEINTICPLHLSAILGHNDILVNFLDKDVPVDLLLKSGTTCLQVASFAGHVDTVQILCDVFKADINRQDGYGWSALHYASSEGHFEIVKILVEGGADVNLRDQDGTTAAFRAEIAEQQNIVNFLCKHGNEDELLNIYEDSQKENRNVEDMYAKVDKSKKPHKIAASEVNLTKPSGYEDIWDDPDTPFQNPLFNKEVTSRSMSVPDAIEHTKTPVRKSSLSKSVPVKGKKMGRNTIRRIFRKELEAMFEDDYMTPEELKTEAIDADEGEYIRLGGEGIGVNTMKGIMREELDRYRKEALKSKVAGGRTPTEEDLYASLAELPPAPLPPTVAGAGASSKPELPPRNPHMLLASLDDDEVSVLGSVRLKNLDLNNSALNESIKKLASRLGDNWKKLAKALPIDPDPSKMDERIKAIEKTYPHSTEKQAGHALAEWRINKGREADIDALIIALRKCGLPAMIHVVEKVTQEFTA